MSASAGSAELPGYKQVRRERIVAAALAALREHEYEQIQMRDVADRADVALGTVYRYFSSKEHVYAEVLMHWAQPVFGDRPVAGSSASTVDRVRETVRGIIAGFERRPAFFKVCLLLQNTGDHNAAQVMTAFADAAQDRLADDFVALGPQQARDTALMLWGIVNTMLTATLMRGYPIADAYRVVDEFIDLLAPRLAE